MSGVASRIATGLATRVPDRAWEDAYRRFETPAAEVRKFLRRLRRLGAGTWARDARIAELFCGRGGGLVALERLGFTRLAGVDRSPSLLTEYAGSAERYVADCRELPFPDSSKDVLIVQGGLHHLERLPGDLDDVLVEAWRVLVPGGRLALVEPWPTPFLGVVHAACRSRVARRLWPRLDSLATMIDLERATYEQWLARPAEILARLDRLFVPLRIRIRAGKLLYVGRPRAGRERGGAA